jgi:hypothetical protein
LFRNFRGRYNTIESYFFDLKYAKTGATSNWQSLIDDGASGSSNTFNSAITPHCVDNYRGNCKYNFLLDYGGNPTRLTNGRVTLHVEHTRIAPSANALPQCASAITLDQGEAKVAWATDRYPTFDQEHKTLTDIKALGSDTVQGRAFYMNAAKDTEVTITITLKENVTLDSIFFEYEETYLKNFSCKIGESEILTLPDPDGRKIVSFINTSRTKATTATIKFTVGTTMALLKRLSAIAEDSVNGTY